MIKVSKECEVHKFIPKLTFKTKQGYYKVKTQFEIIKKFTLLYKLSEDTLNTTCTDEVKEILIFEIELKEKIVPVKSIEFISNTIPYKTIFVLRYCEEKCCAFFNKKVFFNKWNSGSDIKVHGINLENIYSNLLKSILSEDNNNIKIDRLIDKRVKTDKLKNDIQIMENKVKNEKQFNRKVELNIQLSKLLAKLKEISDE